MTQEQAEEDSNVVLGTLFVFGCSTYVLFGSGCMHIFVSRKFACKLLVKLEKPKFELCVSTAAENILCTKEVLIRSCKLEVADRTLFVI